MSTAAAKDDAEGKGQGSIAVADAIGAEQIRRPQCTNVGVKFSKFADERYIS